MVENDRLKSGYKVAEDTFPYLKPPPPAELFFQGSVNHLKFFRFLPYGPYNSTAVEGLIEVLSILI